MAEGLVLTALIVEDDPGVARLIERMLPPDFAAERAGTKAVALRSLGDPSRDYRLVLIDVALGTDATAGLEVLDAASQRPRLVRALVTAAKSRSVTNHAASRSAYLVGKPFASEQLAPLIEAARLAADPVGPSVERYAAAWALTARHREIVHLLAAGRTREEIPLALGISTNTFRAHVREILFRSGEHSLDSLLITLLRDSLAR